MFRVGRDSHCGVVFRSSSKWTLDPGLDAASGYGLEVAHFDGEALGGYCLINLAIAL